jgi:methylmalonyl-CoA mutase C-terminal domain/subunit
MSERKIRILLAKIGLCIHDVGVKVLATSLRNAGMEVIYTGLFQTPEKIAAAAIQESVDIVGISIAVDPAVPVMREVLQVMKERNIADIPVICGGRINRKDIPTLKEIGVKGIFRWGIPMAEIIDSIRQIATQSVSARSDVEAG